MANSNLKVSIIMPVYKASATIEQAVASVINQSYKNWELIIVNDCCPEDSCKLVRKQVVSNPRIIQIDNANNQGVVTSRNTGIAQAKGRSLHF